MPVTFQSASPGDTPEWAMDRDNDPPFIAACRKSVRECQAFRATMESGHESREVKDEGSSDQPLFDMNTASVIAQVYDALSDRNKGKFLSSDVVTMAHIAWQVTLR